MISFYAVGDLTFLFSMKSDITVTVLFLKREDFSIFTDFNVVFLCAENLLEKLFVELLHND